MKIVPGAVICFEEPGSRRLREGEQSDGSFLRDARTVKRMADDFILFTGTANPNLAASISRELGVQLGACEIQQFPDGEISVKLNQPVRCKEVFILQPTSPPVNEHLVELLVFADACRRASAAHVTAIVPYFGYARADKRHGRREQITASMVADLLQAVGVDHVVTIDGCGFARRWSGAYGDRVRAPSVYLCHRSAQATREWNRNKGHACRRRCTQPCLSDR